ncbi:MAG: phytanoyl-CoA dioxygenase family protein [Pseudomonadales bacterium]|nr:phytanoyl-CoA dioxygenase family protein [Pseudomonadales bacterium]
MSYSNRGRPTATRDLQCARADMDDFGYCLLEGALCPDQLIAIRARLFEQKEAEEQLGVEYHGKDKKQLIKFLLNKGKVFRDLLLHPALHELLRHVLGTTYQLSSYHAHFAHPGSEIAFHTDQFWMPPPVGSKNTALVKPGSITRVDHRGRRLGDGEAPSSSAIAPAFVCNAMWMLDDFSEENGATIIVPGSHLSGQQPDPTIDANADWVSATGPAGTVAIFEGRVWHSTGINRSDRPRIGLTTNFCAPQFRQQENFMLGTSPEVLAEASEELLALIGFKPWQGYGGYEGHYDRVKRGEYALGELTPK